MRRTELNLIPLALMGLVLAGTAFIMCSCTPYHPDPAIEAFDPLMPLCTIPHTKYLRELSHKRVASNWDGMMMVYKLTPEKDNFRSMPEMIKCLKFMKVVPCDWSADKPQRLTDGKLAVMVCNALGLKGGVMKHLAGDSERYAVLELRYRNILQKTVSDQYTTGADLIGIIRRASEYKKEGVVQ